jgi:hypothetical protein
MELQQRRLQQAVAAAVAVVVMAQHQACSSSVAVAGLRAAMDVAALLRRSCIA